MMLSILFLVISMICNMVLFVVWFDCSAHVEALLIIGKMKDEMIAGLKESLRDHLRDREAKRDFNEGCG